MDEITAHLKAIEMQNNALLARQSCLGGMLLVLCACEGKAPEKLGRKIFKDMEEALVKYYQEPLEKLAKSEEKE